MKNYLAQTEDVWPAADVYVWQQYDNKRLQRLRQQKIRMQNMKDVVERYTHIINQLQTRNRMLIAENEQLKALQYVNKGQQKQFGYSFYTLQQKYQQVCSELQKQRTLRQNYQITIQGLRRQLINTQIKTKASSYQCYDTHQIKRSQIQSDYDALIGLYEDLKKEVYVLHKQNISLKQVIRNQSVTSYQKDTFWKDNNRQSQSKDKQNKPGVIKYTPSRTNINIKDSTSKNQIEQNKISKRDLLQQIKKQADLIQKFKTTQKQQLQLIQILKSQKTRICSHHALMQTSKKLLLLGKGQDGIVSFKDDQKQSKKS